MVLKQKLKEYILVHKQELGGGAGNGMASEISELNSSNTPPPWPHLHFHQLEPSIPIYEPLGAILI